MREHKSGKYALLGAASLAALFVLSGCVASESTSGLDQTSALSSQIDGSGIELADTAGGSSEIGADTDAVSENTQVDLAGLNVPVPQPSPKSGTSVTALAENETTPAQTEAQQKIASAITDPQGQEASQEKPVETQAADASTDDADQKLTFAKPAPERKQTFFEILAERQKAAKQAQMEKKKEQEAKILQARARVKTKGQVQTASLDTSSSLRGNGGDSLPGVKKGGALFGITTEDSEVEEAANVQVASVGSLGRFTVTNGLLLQTPRVEVSCFKPELMRILKIVERRFGKKVMVTSGYRSPKRNRRAGGVKNSAHVYCKAADIQVAGVSKWKLAKYLRTIPGRGGVGTYCRTKSVHIDVGSQREWHHPCRRSKRKARKKA